MSFRGELMAIESGKSCLGDLLDGQAKAEAVTRDPVPSDVLRNQRRPLSEVKADVREYHPGPVFLEPVIPDEGDFRELCEESVLHRIETVPYDQLGADERRLLRVICLSMVDRLDDAEVSRSG